MKELLPKSSAMIVNHGGWRFAMWKPSAVSAVLYALAADDDEWGSAAELFPPTGRDDLQLLPLKWWSREGRVFAFADCVESIGDGVAREFSAITREVRPDGMLGPCFAVGDDPCRALPFTLLMPCDEPCQAPCESGCAGLVGRDSSI